jgi:ABC-type uncharacterized transport system ATPase subunit
VLKRFYARSTIQRSEVQLNVIEASSLSKTYPGGVTALDGLSFAVEAGTIFGLLGPNGAGKSTTVKILTTLSRADSGAAHVAGLDVVRDAERVRRSIGVVGQRPGLDPDASGRENLELQAEIHGLAGPARRERVERLLDRLGLTDAAGGSRRPIRAACSAASTSRSGSPTHRRCCSSTSQRRDSTPRRGWSSGGRSSGWRVRRR